MEQCESDLNIEMIIFIIAGAYGYTSYIWDKYFTLDSTI